MLSLPFICSFGPGSLQLGATTNLLMPPQNLPQNLQVPSLPSHHLHPGEGTGQKPWLEQGLQQAQLCPAGSTLHPGLSTKNDH